MLTHTKPPMAGARLPSVVYECMRLGGKVQNAQNFTILNPFTVCFSSIFHSLALRPETTLLRNISNLLYKSHHALPAMEACWEVLLPNSWISMVYQILFIDVVEINVYSLTNRKPPTFSCSPHRYAN